MSCGEPAECISCIDARHILEQVLLLWAHPPHSTAVLAGQPPLRLAADVCASDKQHAFLLRIRFIPTANTAVGGVGGLWWWPQQWVGVAMYSCSYLAICCTAIAAAVTSAKLGLSETCVCLWRFHSIHSKLCAFHGTLVRLRVFQSNP